MNEIKSIDPISVGKIMGLFTAIIGFFIGLFITIISVIFGTMGTSAFSQFSQFATSSVPVMQFLPVLWFVGAVAIVVFPIVYGVFGFIWGALAGAIYNLIAGRVGGVKIELA